MADFAARPPLTSCCAAPLGTGLGVGDPRSTGIQIYLTQWMSTLQLLENSVTVMHRHRHKEIENK